MTRRPQRRARGMAAAAPRPKPCACASAPREGALPGVAIVLALLLCAALGAGPAWAEVAPEAQLRAAYLVNFLKYVEWPDGSGGATICLAGRDTLGSQLASYEGRIILGRELRIRRVTQPDQLADCQELFVPEGDEERLDGLLRGGGRPALLTVGESAAFVHQGGGVALLRVDNRLVFDVNLGVLNRAGLKVSPQMLRLARDVVGVPR